MLRILSFYQGKLLVLCVILLICVAIHSFHVNEQIREHNKFADHEGKTSNTGVLIFVIIILISCIIAPLEI